jgi:hypothetical protein
MKNMKTRCVQSESKPPDTISASDEPVMISVDFTGIKITNVANGCEKNGRFIKAGSRSSSGECG